MTKYKNYIYAPHVPLQTTPSVFQYCPIIILDPLEPLEIGQCYKIVDFIPHSSYSAKKTGNSYYFDEKVLEHREESILIYIDNVWTGRYRIFADKKGNLTSYPTINAITQPYNIKNIINIKNLI